MNDNQTRMDAAPLEIHSAAAPLPRAARWIVAGTFALWIIGFIVIALLVTTQPAEQPGGDYTFDQGLWFFIAIPGLPAGLLQLLIPHVSDAALGTLFAVFAVVFTGLLLLAWKRRIKWLAVTLFAWLFVIISFVLVVAFMSWSDSGP